MFDKHNMYIHIMLLVMLYKLSIMIV